MSTDHKRPLLAFVLVAIACTVLIASTARSEALRSYVQQGVARVMPGAELAVDGERATAAPAPAARPTSFDRGEAAPVEGSAPGASRSVPARTLRPQPAARTPRPQAHPGRARVAAAPPRAVPPRVVPPVAAAGRAATPHRPGAHRAVTHRSVAARARRPVTPPGLTRAPARHRAHARPPRARASARTHGRPAHARGNARAHLSARSARR